jgi:N-methylhydantoinase A
VAWLGEAGELHVGPRSAGAHPGPASFGLGGMEPTVTDANVALGWLRPGRLLSGQVRLSASAAEAALEGNLAGRLGIRVVHAASGILEVATAQIANAARQVTLQRGLDPRGVTLIAYGGAGPLHAAAVARELGITRVVIPRVPGNFSAFGMLMADLRQEIVQTVFMRLTEVDLDELEVEFRKLESEAISSLGRSTQDAQAVLVERAADMRYVGQEHAVTVRLPSAINNEITARADIKARFDAAHARRYSHAAEHEAADLVSLRVAVVGRLTRPRLPELPRDRAFAGWTSSAESQRASRIGEARAGVVRRDSLRSGSTVSGPMVIEEEGSTTRVDEGDRVAVDQYGHLIIEVSRT